jgi:hypothetical protein
MMPSTTCDYDPVALLRRILDVRAHELENLNDTALFLVGRAVQCWMQDAAEQGRGDEAWAELGREPSER